MNRFVKQVMPDYPRNSAIARATPLVGRSVASRHDTLQILLDGWTLALAALALCWFSLFMELSDEWHVNPQYGYGYVVPVIGAVLIWRRFGKRPVPSPSKSMLPGFISAFLLFFVLPLDLVLEANPEWRLLYWSHGILVLVLSLCFLYRAGGWTWSNILLRPWLSC